MSTLLLLFRTRFHDPPRRSIPAPRSTVAPVTSRAASAGELLLQVVVARRLRELLLDQLKTWRAPQRQDLALRSAPKPARAAVLSPTSTSRARAPAPRLRARRRPLLRRGYGGPAGVRGAPRAPRRSEAAAPRQPGLGRARLRTARRPTTTTRTRTRRRWRPAAPRPLGDLGRRRARRRRPQRGGLLPPSGASSLRPWRRAFFGSRRRRCAGRAVPYTVAGVVGVASSSPDVDGAAGFGALGGEGRASRSLGRAAPTGRGGPPAARTIRFEYTAPGCTS